MSSFNKGDVVQLKSGGPAMTVSDVADFSGGLGPKEGVKCVWFVTIKGVPTNKEEVFDAAVLVPTKAGIFV